MAKNFEPDEIITKVRVQVHTAAVSDASTDSDIYIELFDWPAELAQLGSLMAYSAEIDSDDNDFEGGDTALVLAAGQLLRRSDRQRHPAGARTQG